MACSNLSPGVVAIKGEVMTVCIHVFRMRCIDVISNHTQQIVYMLCGLRKKFLSSLIQQ